MTVDDLRSSLHESRARLFASIRGLDEEEFRFAREPGAWNIATHLAHLFRIERIFAERARAALIEDGVACPSTRVANDDDPALARQLAVPQIIHGMQAARRELEAVLDGGEDALARSIMHETRGRMTIAEVAQKMADHEREHGADVGALARQAAAARRVTIPITPRA